MTHATSFFTRDGDAYVPSDATIGPWGPGLLHGGPVSALAATLMEQQSDPGFQSLRLLVELLRPATLDPITADVRTVRTGKRADTLSCELSANGKLVAKASLLRVRPVEITVPETMGVDPSPPPDTVDDYEPYDLSTNNRTSATIIGTGVDMRVKDQRTIPGTGVVWMRVLLPVIDGIPLSTMARAAVHGDFGNGLSAARAESWPPPVSFMNADLDVRLLREVVGEWVRIDADSTWTTQGLGVMQSTLADEAGLFGVAQESLVLQPTT